VAGSGTTVGMALVNPGGHVPGSEAGEQALRTIIADDDPLVRRMVRDILQAAGIVVVAEARDGREAVELTLYYRPDVVLMDVIMPKLDGIMATSRIVENLPEQAVVLLTRAGDDDLGVLGLRAGAMGFLHKDMELDSLPRVLRGVAAGEAAVSRAMTKQLIQHMRGAHDEEHGLVPIRSRLTAREWEVLDLLCDDATTSDIADALVLSQETVRSHVKNILRKLDVRSRQEAVALTRRLRGLD
jgi:NarL family two-component system response regulator LiaR